MRRSSLITAGLLLALASLAQTKTDKAQVSWGPELSSRTDGDFLNIIDEAEDGIYQLMQFKKDLHVQKMDLSMKVIYRKPLDLELDRKDLLFEEVQVVGDHILVFASRYDKKTEANTLYMRTYDAADMTPTGRYEKIARIPAGKRGNKGAFSLHASPDGSKIMVEVEQPRMKQGRERFGLKVYDSEMVPIWDADIDLPYADDEFTRESVRVDNDGSVLMMGVRYTVKSERRERKRADQSIYDYHMLVYHAGGQDPQDHLISVKDKFLQDMTISLDTAGGDIICAGFYSDKGTRGIKGPYYLTLDRSTKAIKHESYGVFDRDFITMYMTGKEEKKADKKAKKDDKDLGIEWDYDLRDIIRRDDGGALLMAEEYYMYTVTTCSSSPNGGRTCTTTYHYIYNDIIAVSIDPQGNIEWSAKVPKRQHSVNDGGRYSSYALEVKGDRLYLIFDDTGENLFLKPGDKVKPFELTGKDALVVLVTIDGDGHVSREALFNAEKREAILRPKDCVQLQDDRMFIYASRKKGYRYGMVTFQ